MVPPGIHCLGASLPRTPALRSLGTTIEAAQRAQRSTGGPLDEIGGSRGRVYLSREEAAFGRQSSQSAQDPVICEAEEGNWGGSAERAATCFWHPRRNDRKNLVRDRYA